MHVAQRVGWLVIAAVLFAAIAGIFGGGPISRADTSVESDGARIELEYPRFGRSRSPQELRLRIDAPNATGDTLTVAFSQSFASSTNITGTSPPDGNGELTPESSLTWPVSDWSRPVEISINFEPRVNWRSEGSLTVTIGGLPAQQIAFTQFYFP